VPEEQRRHRAIAMSPAEVDAFLREQPVCRVATTSAGGPHLSPLWFVWDGEAVWLYSLTRSQRWTDVTRDPAVAVLVDAGVDYLELRGVELRGTAELVGEVPRTGTPDDRLAGPERLFADKYAGGAAMPHDGKHAWLRVTPRKVTSWDFRKLAGLGADAGR
jgi:hypothetical protein